MVRFGQLDDEDDNDVGEEYEYSDSSTNRNGFSLSSIIPYHSKKTVTHSSSCSDRRNTEDDWIEERQDISSPSSSWKNGLRHRSRHPNLDSNLDSHWTNDSSNAYASPGEIDDSNDPYRNHAMEYVDAQRAWHRLARKYDGKRYHDPNGYPPPESYYEHPTTKPSSSYSWLRKSIAILVSFFLLRHHDELSLSFQYVSMFTHQLGMDIYNLAKKDASILYEKIQMPIHIHTAVFGDHSKPPAKCILSVPNELPKSLSLELLSDVSSSKYPSATQTWLLNGIVGQDRAIAKIAQALDGWILNDYEHVIETKNTTNPSNTTHNTSTHTNSIPSPVRPLAILLTGPDGVGKSETAHLVSRLLYANCNSNPPLNSESSTIQQDDADFQKHDSILILHGEDYHTASHDDLATYHLDGFDRFSTNNPPLSNQNNPRERLRNKIIHHIHSNKHTILGSVIILTGIEQVNDAATLDVLTEMLSLPNGATLSTSTSTSEFSSTDSLEVTLDRTLFILTTDLGTDYLFRLMQQYDGDGNSIPNIKIDSAIRDALDVHWEGRLKLTKHLDTIASFMPLRHSDLVEIMRRKVHSLSQQYINQSWKRLDVYESALRYLVGTNFVEYLDLRTQTNIQKNSFLVFSRYGAHPLENGGPMHIIRSTIRRYLPPYRNNEVAIFDYIKEEEVGILKWCKEEMDRNEHTRKHYDPRSCEEVWKGRLN